MPDPLSEERSRLAAFARDVGLALTRGGSLRDILQSCCEAMVGHLHGAFARVWTVNESAGVLELQASAGLYTHLDGPHARIPVGQFKIGLIAREGKPHLTNAVVGDPRVHDQEWARREGLVAFAGYPLLVEGVPVGVMALFARHELSEATLEAMASVAHGMALGVRRARAEAERQRLADHLRSLLESTGEGIYGIDAEGRCTFINPAACRLLGYRPEEVLGRNMHDLIHHTHADGSAYPHERCPIFLAFREGRGVVIEDEVLWRRDGTSFPARYSSFPVHEDGGGRGAVVAFNDVSARKRAEEALRRSEASARFLAEAGAALAALVDYESTLQKVAALAVPRFADWCAVDVAEPDGRPRRLAVAHADPDRVRLAHELESRYPPDPAAPHGVPRVLRTGETELVEDIPDRMLVELARDAEHLRILRELGLRSYLCVPMRVRGRVLAAITFVFAESGRRYGPADRDVAEDLAYRAAVAVENARLYQEVRDADRRKGEFIATLAHELRNPLAPVRNTLEALRLRGLDDPQLCWAREVMERQVQLMTRLVDDLLDVTRVSQGKLQLKKEPLELATVVRHALETARPLIDERRHELVLELPAEPLRLEADPARLAQVLSNLLNNAAKYTDPGGRIVLGARRAGGEIEVSVRDNGIGIAADLLPRLFDMFVQAEPGKERAKGGLGIGLSLVRSLVTMHNGRIEARSDGPGRGSEFLVYLPALAADEAREDRPAGDVAPAVSPRNVVVIDDNVDAAESLGVLLRLAGHEVRVAHDGRKGLELVEADLPDVVFLDIGLPGLNGYEVARRIRGRANGRGVVLVAVTGWGQEDDRRRSLEAGFDHHLTKPIDPDVLPALLADPSASAVSAP